jgi:transposase
MALTASVSSVVTNVVTENIGFAPILRYYFEKAAIASIIDANVPTDPRRKVLTHGQAAVAMITGILFQVMQLYRICPFARQSTVLDTVLAGIPPEAYFDDRLADTLDTLYRYGLGNLELELTRHMIETWQIQTDVCHNDTTSASYYGAANHKQGPESIQITFGHSKKHRDDLKQLVWSMSVNGDSAFPLFEQAYSGNTTDVKTYVEQWLKLIDLLDRNDFLYLANSS